MARFFLWSLVFFVGHSFPDIRPEFPERIPRHLAQIAFAHANKRVLPVVLARGTVDIRNEIITDVAGQSRVSEMNAAILIKSVEAELYHLLHSLSERRAGGRAEIARVLAPQ